jgi:hypothetical protein
MPTKHPILSSMALAAALAAPVMIPTSLQGQVGVSIKVYDRDHKDYHVWDDREDKAYRVFLGERHRDYVEYKKLNRRDQSDYWKWRHEHPDDHDRR